MARGASSSKKEERETSREPNPELRERKRLKRLAFADSILSETPAKVDSPLSPSKAVIKHHGKDILKRSQRKNKFLFSFPGLLAPTSGGKIGELKDLGTKNPVLYLDFPQVQCFSCSFICLQINFVGEKNVLERLLFLFRAKKYSELESVNKASAGICFHYTPNWWFYLKPK